MIAAGIPPDQIRRRLAERRPPPADEDDFEVWAGNEAAVELWTAVEGRWIWVTHGAAASMGGMMIESVPVGLDMQAVDVCARALGLTLDRDLLAALTVMEGEALTIVAERRASRR